MSRRLELTVTPELAGARVDTLLKRCLHLSGTWGGGSNGWRTASCWTECG